jgi:V/A-type H+-transporting ATPase subunit I
MIVRMKEIWLFSSTRSVDETIQQLGALGVVDIQEVDGGGNGTTALRLQALENAERAIQILEEHTGAHSDSARPKYVARDPKQLVERILQTEAARRSVRGRLNELEEQASWYDRWGKEVNTLSIKELKNHGLHLRFYLLDRPLPASIKEKHFTWSLSPVKGKIPTVLIGRRSKEKIQGKEDSPPHFSHASIQQQIDRKNRQLLEIEHFLTDQTENIAWLKEYAILLKDRWNMQRAFDGMADIEGRLKYLKGYIPKNTVKAFTTEAGKNGWGYHIQTPAHPEEVPVYIRNPKWIEIINPLMKFIDIVPGYKEVDVSIYFLVAFAIFFAMLVGDAGYGLVFLLVAFLARKKLAPQIRVLVYVLSVSTILWGLLSGTYFGSEEIAGLPVLRDIVIPNIASFGFDNISFMMHLSFTIGVIHLTIAHGIRMVQFINSLKALSELGWIALVWGLYFVTEQLVLGNPMPNWSMWLFAIGSVLVALFSMESKNFLASMGISLANLPLSLISGFSDIVSYVRLFAVGMATAAVAASFNNMILPEGISGMGFLGIIMAAFGLLLGHGLNIVLALMAVMVHGIRLNMLEFAGHLGVQFSGEAYEPFKLTNTKSPFEEPTNRSITTE